MAQNLTSSPNNGNTLVVGIPKRTIKFRAWHDDFGEMIYTSKTWEFGKREFTPFLFNVGFSHYPESDNWKIMQSVELMDIMTKDGYEGDIIERDASDGKGTVRGLIIFQQGQFRVEWFDKNKGWNNSLYIHLPESKIIGNICQNPDLLG